MKEEAEIHEDLAKITERVNKVKLEEREKNKLDPNHSLVLLNPCTPKTSNGSGNITIDNIVYEVFLLVNETQRSERSPTHKLLANVDSDRVHIANVWHNTSEKCSSYFNVNPLQYNPVVLKEQFRLFKDDGNANKYKFV